MERKRYPQYEHCGVIVAEDITSRFLNVISLFNGMIPLIAIQMTAIKMENGIGLTFTKVIDEMSLGLADVDEEVVVVDRAYWENLAPKQTLNMADQILVMLQKLDSALEFKYNRVYIGMAKGGVTNNFAVCKPKKKHMILELSIPKDEKLTAELEEVDLDLMEYKWGMYRLRLRPDEMTTHAELIERFLRLAHEHS